MGETEAETRRADLGNGMGGPGWRQGRGGEGSDGPRVLKGKRTGWEEAGCASSGVTPIHPEVSFFLSFLKFIYLFLAALGLCCCVWAFSSCIERGATLRCGAWAHCGGFSCCRTRALGMWASVVVACGL